MIYPEHVSRLCMLLIFLALTGFEITAQPQLANREKVVFLTREWTGERDQFGRPVVADDILERIKYVAVEEAWGTLKEFGYHNQLEVGWEILRPDQPMVGRALTTAFLPKRPGLDDRMIALGNEADLSGGTNQWPMDMLTKGDVIVADHYGKSKEGAFLGDNLAQAIYTNTGNGAIIYGQSRDIAGIRNIEGVNIWAKSWHPSHSAERMLISINDIIRVGEAVVLPGDVVLATEAGVIFIPPHLAEAVILSSEVIRLVDAFRQEVMASGKYTSQQVYKADWSGTIDTEFYQWLSDKRVQLNEGYFVPLEIIDRMVRTKQRDWKQWLKE